jgi:hypothetical protein
MGKKSGGGAHKTATYSPPQDPTARGYGGRPLYPTARASGGRPFSTSAVADGRQSPSMCLPPLVVAVGRATLPPRTLAVGKGSDPEIFPARGQIPNLYRKRVKTRNFPHRCRMPSYTCMHSEVAVSGRHADLW